MYTLSCISCKLITQANVQAANVALCITLEGNKHGHHSNSPHVYWYTVGVHCCALCFCCSIILCLSYLSEQADVRVLLDVSMLLDLSLMLLPLHSVIKKGKQLPLVGRQRFGSFLQGPATVPSGPSTPLPLGPHRVWARPIGGSFTEVGMVALLQSVGRQTRSQVQKEGHTQRNPTGGGGNPKTKSTRTQSKGQNQGIQKEQGTNKYRD